MNFGPYAFGRHVQHLHLSLTICGIAAPDLPETWQTISSINPQLIFADMASKNEPIEDANSDTSDESDTPLAWKARLMTSTGLKAEMEKVSLECTLLLC